VEGKGNWTGWAVRKWTVEEREWKGEGIMKIAREKVERYPSRITGCIRLWPYILPDVSCRLYTYIRMNLRDRRPGGNFNANSVQRLNLISCK